jgi:hypothetical protein
VELFFLLKGVAGDFLPAGKKKKSGKVLILTKTRAWF